MATWAAFLAHPATTDPQGRVLAAATVEEMRFPGTVTNEALWQTGFGLGVIIEPQGRFVTHIGHDGAMPGFLASAYGRRGGDGVPDGLSCAVLGSSGTSRVIGELAHELLRQAVEFDPAGIRPWRIAAPAPRAYRSILGHWYSEGTPFVFSWHDGALQARAADLAPDVPPAIFEPLPDRPDVLRTVSGRETGELLRLTRDESGTVVRMHWATYRVTRGQEGFDGGAACDGPE